MSLTRSKVKTLANHGRSLPSTKLSGFCLRGEAVHRLVTLLVFNHNLVQPTIMPGTVPLGQYTRNPVTQGGYGKNREMNT